MATESNPKLELLLLLLIVGTPSFSSIGNTLLNNHVTQRVTWLRATVNISRIPLNWTENLNLWNDRESREL